MNSTVELQNEMFNDTPLVSVIIPAYNAEEFIGETLTSIMNQSYQNLEIIVINDGSTDQTSNIVHTFIERDNRIVLIEKENSGVASTRNAGIKHARGEFIAPVDADDLWYSTKIEKQINCFSHVPNTVGLVYTWTAHIDRFGNIIGYHKAEAEGYVLSTMMEQELIGNASVPLIRKSCLAGIGLYDATLKTQNAEGLEDFDLYLRLAEHYEFRVVPEVLVGYRHLLGSMSRNLDQMSRSYNAVIANLKTRQPDIPPHLYIQHRAMIYYWFANLGRQSGAHFASLSWLLAAFKLTPAPFLKQPGFYKLVLLSCLNLCFQPLTSLFWTPQTWSEFKLNFKKKYKLLN